MFRVAGIEKFRLPWRTTTVVVVALAFLRLAHFQLLWSDEDYHLAAALHILHGKIPYRDFWYDKPPLDALYYLLIGAHPGVLLRVLDGVYVCTASLLVFFLGRDLWSEAEGLLAAFLQAFFLTFYLPAGVIPFAADALLLVPHLAAVLCAQRGRFIWSGVWAGIGFLFNTKGLFLLPACAFWAAGDVLWLLAGFALPVMIGSGILMALRAWPAYIEQVWTWGLVYARHSPAGNVFTNGLHRVLDWAGFHAALVLGTIFGVQRNWKLLLWIAFSFSAVGLGGRFVPRYFLQVLPPLAVVASRGIAVLWQKYGRNVAVMGVLLLVPLIRFGPRYIELMVNPQPRWTDVALDEDSRAVAGHIARQKQPGDTVFVWGYRPNIYVYSRTIAPGPFWDSQPLTGVPADRHLETSLPVYQEAAALNRRTLIRSQPTFLVDGLGLLNNRLAPQAYPEVRGWMQNYAEIYRTPLSILYRRRP